MERYIIFDLSWSQIARLERFSSRCQRGSETTFLIDNRNLIQNWLRRTTPNIWLFLISNCLTFNLLAHISKRGVLASDAGYRASLTPDPQATNLKPKIKDTNLPAFIQEQTRSRAFRKYRFTYQHRCLSEKSKDSFAAERACTNHHWTVMKPTERESPREIVKLSCGKPFWGCTFADMSELLDKHTFLLHDRDCKSPYHHLRSAWYHARNSEANIKVYPWIGILKPGCKSRSALSTLS